MKTLTPYQTDTPAVRYIYLVISQSGSWLSQLLKIITGAEYNHISISLSPDLVTMYSFGRIHPYNPFWGGFVVESLHWGTFKRFSEAKGVVISVPVSGESYFGIARTLDGMLMEQATYRYNYLGLVLAGLRIQYRRSRRYYCSEFVKELLLRSCVKGATQLSPIVQPIQFLSLPNGRTIYRGYLRDYSGAAEAREEAEPAARKE